MPVTYHAYVRYEASTWRIYVRELDRSTYCYQSADVASWARALVADALDVPVDSFDLEIELLQRIG